MATTSTAARPLVVAVTLAALALAAQGEEPAGGVLELPGGRSLAGRLVPFEADGTPLGTLRWQAPRFTAPLEFHMDEITAVRLPGAKAAGARPGVVVHLRGGDAIEGEL